MARPITNEGGDWDPRNHKSFLVPGYETECLITADDSQRPALNALLMEAEVFKDEELKRFCLRNGAIQTTRKNARVETMARVAVHDESLRKVEAEDVAPRSVV